MKIRVEEYIRPDGSSPYAEWFDSLDAQAAAKEIAKFFHHRFFNQRGQDSLWERPRALEDWKNVF